MLKEYHVDLTKLHEWLPWGGLVCPQIVKNKDGSLLGFISYQGHPMNEDSNIVNFSDGWAIWTEYQHFQGKIEKILTLFWKPFTTPKTRLVTNGLEIDPIHEDETEPAFLRILEKLKNSLSIHADAKIMEYDEILEYLGSTIRGDFFSMQMPETPLYLDAILSKDVDFKVFGTGTEKKNELCINGNYISIVTPLGYPPMPIMGILFRAYRDLDYRFVRRFIFAGQDRAKKEMDGYMKEWCHNRKSIKTFLKQGLDRTFNGIYTNAFVFRFNEEERAKNEEFIKNVLETIELPHIVEDYNRKHTWWATIPGIHQAGLTAPIKGIDSLIELLAPTEEENATA